MPDISDYPGTEAAPGIPPGAREPTLEPFRRYLAAIAHRRLSPQLRTKVGSSDLAQETIREALARISRFPGGTEAALREWLREILKGQIVRSLRKHFRKVPGVGWVPREVSLEPGGGTSARPWDGLVANQTSPSRRADRNAQIESVRQALERLSDRDRQVLLWKNRDNLTFQAIGQRLGISAPGAFKAVRKALKRLKRELDAQLAG